MDVRPTTSAYIEASGRVKVMRCPRTLYSLAGNSAGTRGRDDEMDPELPAVAHQADQVGDEVLEVLLELGEVVDGDDGRGQERVGVVQLLGVVVLARGVVRQPFLALVHHAADHAEEGLDAIRRDRVDDRAAMRHVPQRPQAASAEVDGVEVKVARAVLCGQSQHQRLDEGRLAPPARPEHGDRIGRHIDGEQTLDRVVGIIHDADGGFERQRGLPVERLPQRGRLLRLLGGRIDPRRDRRRENRLVFGDIRQVAGVHRPVQRQLGGQRIGPRFALLGDIQPFGIGRQRSDQPDQRRARFLARPQRLQDDLGGVLGIGPIVGVRRARTTPPAPR